MNKEMNTVTFQMSVEEYDILHNLAKQEQNTVSCILHRALTISHFIKIKARNGSKLIQVNKDGERINIYLG